MESIKLIASLAILSTLATCGYRDTVTENVRKITYPSDFSYVTKDQVSSTMHTMGRELRALNTALRERDENTDPKALQAEVLTRLAEIDRAAQSLESQTSWQSNHPNMKRNLSRLRTDVRDARRAAQKDPPSYFLAGSVSGACLYCHGDGK